MDRLAPLKVVVVPKWTHRWLLLNGLGLEDISNYPKLRERLAVNDIVDLVSANSIVRVEDTMIATQSDPFHTEGLDPLQLADLRNSVLPESGVESSASYLRDKLNQLCADGDRYEILKSQHTIYVVVDEGFLQRMTIASARLKFVRDFLKECYSMASVDYVNCSVPLFKVYVNLISQKA